MKWNEMKFFKHSKFFNTIARIINPHIQIPTIKWKEILYISLSKLFYTSINISIFIT
jgi:hypothetical protein